MLRFDPLSLLSPDEECGQARNAMVYGVFLLVIVTVSQAEEQGPHSQDRFDCSRL